MRLPLEPEHGNGPLLRSLLWRDVEEEEERPPSQQLSGWYILLIVVCVILKLAWIYFRFCHRRTVLVETGYVTLVTPCAASGAPVADPRAPPPYCKDDPRMSAGHI